MAKPPLKQNDWVRLPSGRIATIRKITGESRPDATLRYLDDNGVMSTGEFEMKFEFLQKFAVKVGSS
jgi:hypothetical protein